MSLTLTQPYGQAHYVGEYAGDSAANTAIASMGWTVSEGMLYFDNTGGTDELKVYDGSAWQSLAGGGSSPWTLTSGTVHPTVLTNDVAIGANASAGNERFYILDDNETAIVIGAFSELQKNSTGDKNIWKGFLASPSHTGAGGGGDYVGFEATAEVDNVSATIADLKGFSFVPALYAGTFTALTGHYAQPDTDNDATVATYYGFRADGVGGSGTVTKSVGLGVSDMGLSSTTTYGIEVSSQTGTTARGVYVDDSIELTGTLVFGENADHTVAPAAGTGLLWVRNDTPNVLIFTDDDGVDHELGAAVASLWNETSGVLHPATLTNDVAVNRATMFGAERFLVFDDDETTSLAGAVSYLEKNSTGTKAEWVGFQAQVAHTGAGDGTVYKGFSSKDTINNAAASITSLFGMTFEPTLTDGAISGAYAVYSMPTIASGKTIGSHYAFFADGATGLGTVTKSVGLEVSDMGQNSTTAYGVEIAAQTGTTARGIYCNDSIELTGTLVLGENADHTVAPGGGTGLIWVRNDAPSVLVFTDDAGTDHTVASPWSITSGVVHPGTLTNDVAVNSTTVPSGTAAPYLYVNDTEDTTEKAGVRVNFTKPGTGASPQKIHYSYYSLISHSTTANANIYTSFYGQADFNGSGTLATARIASSTVQAVDGTITNADCFYGNLIASGGTITNAHGVRIFSDVSAGDITNAYGLWIDGMNGSSSSYGIYQSSSSDQNYFAGQTKINSAETGTDTPYLLVEDSQDATDRTGIEVFYSKTGTGINKTHTSFFSDVQLAAAATVSSFVNFEADTQVGNASGTINNARSYQATATASNGTIANYRGVNIASTVTSGSITNSYGVYIAAMNGSTASFGIYQGGSGDQNYFAGQTKINSTETGTDTPYLLVEDTEDANDRTGIEVLYSKVSTGAGKDHTSLLSDVSLLAAATVTSYVNCDADILVDDAGGTISNARGYQARATATNGTITNYRGVNVRTSTSGGTITNSYGVYIAAMNGGTLSYGLYQADSGDANYFAGHTGIGATPISRTTLTVSDLDQASGVSYGVTVNHDKTSTASGHSHVSYRSDIDHTGDVDAGSYVCFQGQVTMNEVGNTMAEAHLHTASLNAAVGTVTDYRGFYALPVSAAGTVTNAYQIWLGAGNGTSSSYGIYQAANTDDNYFAGAVYIADSTPSATAGKLNVEINQDATENIAVRSKCVKTSGTSQQFAAFIGEITHTADVAGTDYTCVAVSNSYSPSGAKTLNSMHGYKFNSVIGSNATVISVKGFTSEPVSTSGNVANWYSFFAGTPNSSSITNAYGLYIQEQDGSSSWGVYQQSANDDNYFAGNVGIKDSTPSYALDINGDANLQTGHVLRVNGTQVVSGRRLGWTAATGTGSRATFDVATVTTAQLAQRVKALIDDLGATSGHGLINA